MMKMANSVEMQDDGHFKESPLTLKAKHCNGGDVPGLSIIRRLGPLSKDPYDEDGQKIILAYK